MNHSVELTQYRYDLFIRMRPQLMNNKHFKPGLYFDIGKYTYDDHRLLVVFNRLVSKEEKKYFDDVENIEGACLLIDSFHLRRVIMGAEF